MATLIRRSRIASRSNDLILSNDNPDNAAFNPKSRVAIDTETTGLRVWGRDVAFAVGMADEECNTWYTEWPIDPFTRQIDVDKIGRHQLDADAAFIRQFANSNDFECVFHNSKFDYRMLQKSGIETIGCLHDTHVAARIANNIEFTYGLKDLAKRHLGIPNDDERDLKEIVKKWRRRAGSYNTKARKEDQRIILLGEEVEEDYWLPRYFDPTDQMCEKYCRLDVIRTMCLWVMYEAILDDDQHLADSYQEEMELWYALNDMEERGMRVIPERVDTELAKAEEAVTFHMNNMREIIMEKGLLPFKDGDNNPDRIMLPPEEGGWNPKSTPQLVRVLYLPESEGGLGLVTERKTDAGNASTDKNALRELMHEPFVREVVAHRAAKQAITLFFEKYNQLMVPDTICEGCWCLHPGLNQAGTVTFRFSSNDPNLQQVSNPKSSRDQGGNYQVRGVFGPRPGHLMYAGDYSQQELRIFSDIYQIEFFLREIREGRDPNNALANRAWGGRNNPSALKAASFAMDLGREKPSNDLVAALWREIEWNAKASHEFGFHSMRSQQLADWWLGQYGYDIVVAEKSLDRGNTRARGKCVMFAKIYGGGPGSVTELIYCTLAEAKAFFNDIDRAIPEIRECMLAQTRQARLDGYVINPYGRKVRVEPDFAYKSVNYMIQSTAACMMKDSVLRCWKYLKGTGLDAHVLMTIHDELLFEVRKDHAYKWLLRNLMDIMADNQGRIGVPMPVELKRIRESWDMKENLEL